MVVVLVSARAKKLIAWLNEELGCVGIIKQVGPKYFLYIDLNLTSSQLLQRCKTIVEKHAQGGLVYQFYTVYNGKIDYNSYLSNETKDQMDYYQQKADITHDEIEKYKRTCR